AAFGPRQPVVEERSHAGLAPLGGEGGLHGGLDEALRGKFDDGELERLLGLKMREKAALRKPEVVGQLADGEPLETELGGKAHRALENRVPGQLAFAHGPYISTNVRLCNPRDEPF